jgi:hypothetical protein
MVGDSLGLFLDILADIRISAFHLLSNLVHVNIKHNQVYANITITYILVISYFFKSGTDLIIILKVFSLV